MLGFAARRLLAASISSTLKTSRARNSFLQATRTALPRIGTVNTENITQMGKKSYYAVARGHVPGIYRTWDDCSAQVQGFKGNRFKGFETESEARQYLQQHGAAAAAIVRGSTTTTHKAASRVLVVPRPSAHQRKATVPAPRHKATAADRLGDLAEQPLPVSSSLEATTAETSTSSVVCGVVELGPRVAPGRTARVQFDGASKRNPGPAALGAVIYDDETGAEVGRVRAYMGDYHTNNQAEYAGFIAGLQAAWEMGYRKVEIQGDSTLIVKQVLGQWRVKNEGLMPYHAVAVAMSKKFDRFTARQVPRAQNSVADALGNQAIDEWRQGNGGRMWTIALAEAAVVGAIGAEVERDRKRQKLL